MRHVSLLTSSKPIVDAAVLFPNTTITINHLALSSFYEQCALLRDVLDFDVIDERMVCEGVLRKYRFLVLLEWNTLRYETLEDIKNWVEGGGIVITPKPLTPTFPESKHIEMVGQGRVLVVNNRGHSYLDAVRRAIYNYNEKYPWAGIPEIDDSWDGVYATRLKDKILYYNSNDFSVDKLVAICNASSKIEFKVGLKPHSIMPVNVSI
jgi:hypothetical protein